MRKRRKDRDLLTQTSVHEEEQIPIMHCPMTLVEGVATEDILTLRYAPALGIRVKE